METHQIWIFFFRKAAHIGKIVLDVVGVEDVVLLELFSCKHILWLIYSLIQVKVFENCAERSSVHLISHSSSVVALACKVLECLERNFCEILDHQVQLSHRDPKVRVIEIVSLIPTERAVSLPFANNGVEEGETLEQREPLVAFFVCLPELQIQFCAAYL